ncbi:MAG: START-like domain-containing protein [bacterium]
MKSQFLTTLCGALVINNEQNISRMKKEYVIEYDIKASPKILFDRLSTTWGLSEWFADDVNQSNDLFVFVWDGIEQKARVVDQKDQRCIRFQWLDEDEPIFFEFKIKVDELTRDITLQITDYAEEGEVDDAIELWNAQIETLKHTVGS